MGYSPQHCKEWDTNERLILSLSKSSHPAGQTPKAQVPPPLCKGGHLYLIYRTSAVQNTTLLMRTSALSQRFYYLHLGGVASWFLGGRGLEWHL